MKFKIKPVIIEAEQWFPGKEIEGVINHSTVDMKNQNWKYWATVETSEGFMRADSGDWIITGVKGEKYPCKDYIFKMSYEKMNDE